MRTKLKKVLVQKLSSFFLQRFELFATKRKATMSPDFIVVLFMYNLDHRD